MAVDFVPFECDGYQAAQAMNDWYERSSALLVTQTDAELLTLGYVLTINFLVSSIIRIPSAKLKGIPQNIPGIGVVKNTFCRPGPYKFVTAISEVAIIPRGTARFWRGPQRGLEFRIDTRRLRTERRPPNCMKTIVT